MIRQAQPFKVGDKVFGKVKGYPAWPAKITEVKPGKRYSVVFYGTNETAVLTQNNIFYYLKNKDKFNLQKRKYFAEAIIDIEEDIKQGGGSDGNQDGDTEQAHDDTKPSTNKRKRKISLPEAQTQNQTPQSELGDENASNKRHKTEESDNNNENTQNSQVSDLKTSTSSVTNLSEFEPNSEVETTTLTSDSSTSTYVELVEKGGTGIAMLTQNSLEIQDGGADIEDDLTETESTTVSSDESVIRFIPSTIIEATETEKTENTEEALSNLDSEQTILHNDENVDLDSGKGDLQDSQDFCFISEFYLIAITIYADRVKNNAHYYKTIPPDLIGLDTHSSNTDFADRIKVLPVKITKDNDKENNKEKYAGLIYNAKKPGNYRCEYDRAIEDAQNVQELVELQAELSVGNEDLVDSRIIKNLNFDSNTAKIHAPIVSYKKHKLQWLQNELHFFEHIIETKKCLKLKDAKPVEALEHLKVILEHDIEVISLKKRPQNVDTFFRLSKYVGNVKDWAFSHDAIVQFEQYAFHIRDIAGHICTKIRHLFEYGQGDDFQELFQRECQEFQTITKYLSEEQVYSLSADPRSRVVQMELIYDEHAAVGEVNANTPPNV